MISSREDNEEVRPNTTASVPSVDAEPHCSAPSGHTPGPWEFVNKVVKTEWGGEHHFQLIRAPGTMVKNDRGPDYAREVFSDEDYPEKVADGHLIAAAPKLLDALKAWDRYMLETGGYSGPESDALHPEAARVWRLVRAAIAEAQP